MLLLKLRPITPRQREHQKFLLPKLLLPVPFYPHNDHTPGSIFSTHILLPPLLPVDFRQRQSERTVAIYTQPLQYWVFCTCLNVAVTASGFGKIVCSTISNPISAKVEARIKNTSLQVWQRVVQIVIVSFWGIFLRRCPTSVWPKVCLLRLSMT